ncbi:MAG: hypothetical protein J6Z01_15420 [Bacteroidales bacterium]|nr:hypothetical protein [Bacteroidales bacterium]
MKNTTSRFVILIISVLCISFQPLFAQKLGKGFKYLEDNDYAKAMEYFSNAKNKGTELFATYYALSKLYSDSQSPYFKAEQALVTIKRAIAHKKTEKISEESIKKHYNFDFTDVDIQYNYALLLVLNNVDKIETITRLFKTGLNNDYEHEILEEKAYKCALQENTTVAYSRFLDFFKDSKFVNQAKENYIKAWFEKADSYVLAKNFRTFKIRFPESNITKNCETEDDYIRLRNQAVISKDYQLDPILSEIVANSDSLNLRKDDILQYYITNFCKKESKTVVKVKPEFRLNNFTPREKDIEIGAIIATRSKTTQKAKPKSTLSGKDFVMRTYGDNRYAINDFNRGRRAIAFYYTHYFNTDIDWEYFADSLDKVDFDDPRFKAAIARLQTDFPQAFYEDNSNSVGNNVFTRICGAEIINNFGVTSPIFKQFENKKIPNSNLTFKSTEHFSSFLNPKTHKYQYYFVATTPDSVVYGAYALTPEFDSLTFKGYKLLNINPVNNRFRIFRSNSPGLVFYERKWRNLYYLVEQKKGNSSIWVVKKKYKRE